MSTFSKSILIVDDDPIAREVIAAVLSSKGRFQIVSVGEGAKAFELIQKQKFDLVCCDLNMPGFDGVELMMGLSRHSSNVPFVLVSAAAEPIFHSAEQLAKAVGLRLLGALRKPVKKETLWPLVSGILAD